MRKTLILGFALAAATAALGWLVDEKLFVLTAYVGVIFVPVIVVGLLYNLFTANGSKNQPWPPRLGDPKNEWPVDLNPDRKHDNIDPMW